MPKISDRHSAAARVNGAKSKGPTTPEAKERCRQAAIDAAARRAVALTFDCTRLPTESRQVYNAIAAQETAYWQPGTPSELQLVMELIDINWRICRIRFAQNNDLLANMETQRQRAAMPELSSEMAARAEAEGSVPGGTQLNLDRRVALLTASRDRVIRALERLAKRFPTRPGPQHTLKTEHLPAECSWRVPGAELDQAPALTYPAEPETLLVDPPEPTQTPEPQPQSVLTWARENLAFDPDPFQKDLMTNQAREILVLGGRQTGKSTAAAIRVIHEALHNDNSTILLAGPTGRQSGHIMVKSRAIAKSLGLALGAPPPGCDGFRLPNGSEVISLPDNEATIRGFSAPRLIVVDEAAYTSDAVIKALKPMLSVSNGAIILLTTPNGQSGYFYDRWHDKSADTHRIFCPSSQCARIDENVLKSMSQSMSAAEFKREFECEFLAGAQQAIPRDLYRRNLRNDIKPMFEEEE